jgi:predicted alpha/beta superfamily hydrolase
MRAILTCSYLAFLLFLSACDRKSGAAPSSPTVKITFLVELPADLPSNARPSLSGDHAALGSWKPDGLPLEKTRDGHWKATVSLPRALPVHFKATLGSWQTVEKSETGADVPNRTLLADADKEVKIAVARFAKAEPRASTRTGDIRLHEAFASKILDNRRNVIVYLPPGYERDSAARYPVFYMHDGQNLFDEATGFSGEWHADESAQRLIAEKKIKPIIIVGIYNNFARIEEYTPYKSKDGRGGKGADYARFLLEELKPFINKTYRTLPGRESTAVGGSSLGGVISLYLATHHPDTFSKAAVISPALYFDELRLVNDLKANPARLKNLKLWLDMGTAEGAANVQYTRNLAALFESSGMKRDVDFKYAEISGGTHSERAWAQRFDQVLEFLFGTDR